jgi:hypothetical protein
MIDLPTDGSLPDGAFNDDHLGTLDAVRGAVHPISKGSTCAFAALFAYDRYLREGENWSRRLSVHTRTALSERSSSPQSLAWGGSALLEPEIPPEGRLARSSSLATST